MTVPSHSEQPGAPGGVDCAGMAPMVTWREPMPLGYEVVELPAEDSTAFKSLLPPLEMVARPRFSDVPDIATPEEREPAAYRLAALDQDSAALQDRRYREARLQELLAYSRKVRRPARRTTPRRHTHWYQSVVLPFLAWRLLLGLAAGLGLGTILVLPFEGSELIPWHLRYLLPVIVIVWVCGYLQCVLNGALADDPPAVSWPGRHFHVALRYTGWWAFCFLVGPAPMGMAAILYWIYCGELEFLDWLILIQAGVLAVNYFLFALLAVTRSQRIYDANPVRVAELVQRLGYRAAIVIVLLSVLVFEHARYLIFGIGVAHESVLNGWFLLTMYWLSALAAATFLFRLVGWWCFCHIPARR
jgi:hypothetical protein